MVMVLKNTGCEFAAPVQQQLELEALAAEAVQGAALALEGVDDVQGGHGLTPGVLSVGHSITNDVLQEHLEHAARLLIDEAGNALDATTASQTADGRLGDALDVVTQHLAVALGTALAQTLAALAASRHGLPVGGGGERKGELLDAGV